MDAYGEGPVRAEVGAFKEDAAFTAAFSGKPVAAEAEPFPMTQVPPAVAILRQ